MVELSRPAANSTIMDSCAHVSIEGKVYKEGDTAHRPLITIGRHDAVHHLLRFLSRLFLISYHPIRTRPRLDDAEHDNLVAIFHQVAQCPVESIDTVLVEVRRDQEGSRGSCTLVAD